MALKHLVHEGWAMMQQMNSNCANFVLGWFKSCVRFSVKPIASYNKNS